MWKKLWEDDERKTKTFMLSIIIFSAILFVRFFAHHVDAMNATMLAFSYKYGFISRGLIGTVYQLTDKILPFDMMSYTWTYRFTFAVTAVFYFLLFLFFYVCLKKMENPSVKAGRCLVLLLTMTAVPTFCGQYNFGRMDIYCIMVSVLAAILLIIKRAEWLIVLLSGLGVMFHQGYVFMFFNIILVLVLCRAIESEGKDRRKYLLIFGVSFAVASVLFLWFELFSHGQGEEIYEEVVQNAKALALGGGYHKDVVDKEILGIDLTDRETEYHLKNFVQFPIFLVLMFPYIMIGIHFFKNIIISAGTKLEKFKYFAVMAGVCTIIPDLLLKVDYGRWMFAIICYYLVVILSLLAMKDRGIEIQIKTMTEKLKTYPFAVLLLVYPLLFQPFEAMDICKLVADIAEIFNQRFLHFW